MVKPLKKQGKRMNKCIKCNHPCHCAEDKKLHTYIYGVCNCELCDCKDRAEDQSYENNGIMIDDK
tara:strand:- start:271 stop:465 length:195 start_codon:yes stop_codon:yes gene_type:complete